MTKKLKINTAGKGEPLAVIHGWGMNQQVWQGVKKALEAKFTVYWVNLPGHGINQNLPLYDLDHVTRCIADVLPDHTHLLAWSLGGLIAQNMALQFPDKVKQLILVATSPSFVQRAGWQHAMAADTLQSFVENLQKDFAGTLTRFLALQFIGVKGVQAEIKSLRDDLLAKPPTTQALLDGLHILKTADFHSQTQKIKTHWILGKLDRLVPVSVADDLLTCPNNSVDIIPNAGHAPFISHPKDFMQSVIKHAR